MPKEFITGVTFDDLKKAVATVCQSPGMHAAVERETDGYKNGDRLCLFTPGPAQHMRPVVILSHENNTLDDTSGTPRPHELIASKRIIKQVKREVAKNYTDAEFSS